jgi:hypothetical protein
MVYTQVVELPHPNPSLAKGRQYCSDKQGRQGGREAEEEKNLPLQPLRPLPPSKRLNAKSP